MEKDIWNIIEDIYEKQLGIPKRIVNYLAVIDVIKLCISGFSNKSIERRLELDENYIKKVLEEFLGFGGWAVDLDINGWFIYRSVDGHRQGFEAKISPLTDLIDRDIIETLHKACNVYEDILKEIDKYYE